MINVQWNIYALESLGNNISPEYKSRLYNELNTICNKDLIIPGCMQYFQSSQGLVTSRTDVMFEVAFLGGGIAQYGIKKAGAELIEDTVQDQVCNFVAGGNGLAQMACSMVNTSKSNAGVYAPDRDLPTTKNGVPIPDTNVPHTQLGTREGSKGKYTQAREFDENGKPVKRVDFTDHGRSDHPNPHQHPSIENPSGGSPIIGAAEPLSQ